MGVLQAKIEKMPKYEMVEYVLSLEISHEQRKRLKSHWITVQQLKQKTKKQWSYR